MAIISQHHPDLPQDGGVEWCHYEFLSDSLPKKLKVKFGEFLILLVSHDEKIGGLWV